MCGVCRGRCSFRCATPFGGAARLVLTLVTLVMGGMLFMTVGSVRSSLDNLITGGWTITSSTFRSSLSVATARRGWSRLCDRLRVWTSWKAGAARRRSRVCDRTAQMAIRSR